MESQKGKKIVLVTASAGIIIMIVAGVMIVNRSVRQQHDSQDVLFEHSAWMQEQLESVVKSDDFQAMVQKLKAGGKPDPDSVARLNDRIALRIRDQAKVLPTLNEKLLRTLKDQLDQQPPQKVEVKTTRIPIK